MFYRLRNRSELIRQQNAIESGRRRKLTSSSCKERPPQESRLLSPSLGCGHASIRLFQVCWSEHGSLEAHSYLAEIEGHGICLFESEVGQTESRSRDGQSDLAVHLQNRRGSSKCSGELLPMESRSPAHSHDVAFSFPSAASGWMTIFSTPPTRLRGPNECTSMPI